MRVQRIHEASSSAKPAATAGTAIWRRALFCATACAALAPWTPPAAHAMDIDADSGIRVRWDNTVRATIDLRAAAQDPALLANPNGDDGDRAFAGGPVSERVDVVSQLDLTRGDLGFDASADLWYDAAYNRSTDNTSPGTYNPVSVPATRFPAGVRALQGGTIELGTANLHDTLTVHGLPVTVRLGRQVLLWGETLFSTENGIAAGQAPVDVIKSLAQPLASASELYLPVTQVVASVQLRPEISLEGYIQAEWRRDRLPGVGSYFSTVDFLDVGGERLFAATSSLLRDRDHVPTGGGQFGLALRVNAGDVDFGLYALRFDAKSPQLYVVPNSGALYSSPGKYGLVFPRGIALYGISFASYLGDNNIGGEVSWRRDMPLLSRLPALSGPGAAALDAGTPYAAGDTLHAQASIVSVLPPGRVWQGAALAAELAADERLAITRDAPFLAPGRSRFAASLRVSIAPTYYHVLPRLDVTLPVGFGISLVGQSSVLPSEQAGAGDVEVGVRATWRTDWTAALRYTRYVGRPEQQALGDRDFVSLSLQRSF